MPERIAGKEHRAMSSNFITETYSVRGMACTGCETIIHNVLLRTDGVKEAEADFAKNKVKISFDPDKVSLITLQQILKKEGYILDAGSPEGIPSGAADISPSGSKQA